MTTLGRWEWQEQDAAVGAVASGEAERRVVHHRGHREHRVETKMADPFEAVASGEKSEERFFPHKARKEGEVFTSRTPFRMTGCMERAPKLSRPDSLSRRSAESKPAP